MAVARNRARDEIMEMCTAVLVVGLAGGCALRRRRKYVMCRRNHTHRARSKCQTKHIYIIISSSITARERRATCVDRLWSFFPFLSFSHRIPAHAGVLDVDKKIKTNHGDVTFNRIDRARRLNRARYRSGDIDRSDAVSSRPWPIAAA